VSGARREAAGDDRKLKELGRSGAVQSTLAKEIGELQAAK
jgi:hypothetical protein